MTDLLSTRTQRNYGTDHVYLQNANMANIWYCWTGKKTVTDTDISNLRFFRELVREELNKSTRAEWQNPTLVQHQMENEVPNDT